MTVLLSGVQTIGAVQAQLRLLQTTDLHMHVRPYDYYSDRPAFGTGLAHAAGLIARRRGEVANALLFDCGDFLQGTPLGDYVAYERDTTNTAAHPIIAAMNAVGYDAAVVGNHDFNYGLEFLQQALAAARFPVLAANVARQLGGAGPLEDRLLLAGHSLLQRQIKCFDGSTQPLVRWRTWPDDAADYPMGSAPPCRAHQYARHYRDRRSLGAAIARAWCGFGCCAGAYRLWCQRTCYGAGKMPPCPWRGWPVSMHCCWVTTTLYFPRPQGPLCRGRMSPQGDCTASPQ